MLHLDPIPVPLGTIYALPGGVTVWQYPQLADDATPEQRDYRAAQLAALDLAGHRVITDLQELADLLAEGAHND